MEFSQSLLLKFSISSQVSNDALIQYEDSSTSDIDEDFLKNISDIPKRIKLLYLINKIFDRIDFYFLLIFSIFILVI